MLLLAALPLSLVAFALLYMAGMTWLEGAPRDFWFSLEWAAETLSTTGYGADDTWRHPAMVLLVVLVQFVGVFLIFLIFPIYVIPFLEERFEPRLPTSVPKRAGHLVVFRDGPAVSSLLEEARRAGIGVVVIEPDEGRARRLLERGEEVLWGQLEDDVLEAAHLRSARAFIANGSDEENAAVILAARQLGYAGEILALVEDPFHRRPIVLAGATGALTPRHMLAAALATRASRRVSPEVNEVRQIGGRLQLAEARIPASSDIAGRTLAEAGIGQRTGVTVIGQWVGGRLTTQPTAETRIEPRGILVLVGSEEAITRFETTVRRTSAQRAGPFVVAGHGAVGRKVVELLRDVGEKVLAIDRQEGEGVDVVGDVLDTAVLEAAGVAEAQAVVLALDTDSATLFATVILKDVAPDVPVIARVNLGENVERIHRAGADFALSISQVSGQILARRLLGEESIAVDPALKVVRVAAGRLAGSTPQTAAIRDRTGCSVVAVERGEDLIVEIGSDFRFAADDTLYICGGREATRSFQEMFGER